MKRPDAEPPTPGQRPSAAGGRRPWQPMRLEHLGRLSELVHAGGGKLSVVGDPGDARKAPGQG